MNVLIVTMSTTLIRPLAMEHLETAILADVVTQLPSTRGFFAYNPGRLFGSTKEGLRLRNRLQHR